MTLERAFTVLSAGLVIAASVLAWRGQMSAAFVTATLGVVSWFLAYRFHLLAGMSVRDDAGDDSHDDSMDTPED